MSSLKRLEPIATSILTVCALILTVGYVRREFFPKEPAVPRIEKVEDWASYAAGNMRFGDPSAPLQIIEFSDFECPACRKLHRTIGALRRKDSSAIHVTFRNYPLDDIHPSARSAAIAAQCAADQASFEQMHDYLFDRQSSLGSLDWVAAAAVVGVPDTAAFRSCTIAASTLARLSDDSASASRLNVEGTPLVLINGHVYRGAPTLSVIDSLLTTAKKPSER